MEPDWTVTLDINLFRQYAAAVYKSWKLGFARYESRTYPSQAGGRRFEPRFPLRYRFFLFRTWLFAWRDWDHRPERGARARS